MTHEHNQLQTPNDEIKIIFIVFEWNQYTSNIPMLRNKTDV